MTVIAPARARSVRMKLSGFMTGVAALLLPVVAAPAGAVPLARQVGDTYEITLTRESVQRGSGAAVDPHQEARTIKIRSSNG